MLFLSYNMSSFMLSLKYLCIICNSVVHAFSEHRDQFNDVSNTCLQETIKTMKNSKPVRGKNLVMVIYKSF